MKNFSMQIQAWDWKTPVEEIHDWVVKMKRENPDLRFVPIETRNDEYAIAYSEQDITVGDAQRLYELTEDDRGKDEEQDIYERDDKMGAI